jgi:hypothetical protein
MGVFLKNTAIKLGLGFTLLIVSFGAFLLLDAAPVAVRTAAMLSVTAFYTFIVGYTFVARRKFPTDSRTLWLLIISIPLFQLTFSGIKSIISGETHDKTSVIPIVLFVLSLFSGYAVATIHKGTTWTKAMWLSYIWIVICLIVGAASSIQPV